MTFLKKLFSKSETKPKLDDGEYNLEWRNRYLTSRLKYLKAKIEKKGGYVGSVETTLTDIEAVNAFLKDKVDALEKKLKAM